jgi:SAM-dependent methyltransferase
VKKQSKKKRASEARGPRRAARAPRAVAGEYHLYGDLAWLWPLLSPPESYADEAASLVRHYTSLRGRARGTRPSLLDLGAGGGHVIHHLAERFDCTAVDRSPAMLRLCAELVPQAERVLGDLRKVRLERRYDVVLLHDAADYLTSAADVRAALRTAAAHLEPGGVLFVAPTYTREDFSDGEFAQDGAATLEANVQYSSLVHDPNPKDTRYELVLVYMIHDLVRRRVRVVEDRHQCGLFAKSDWLDLLDAAGFDMRHAPDDNPWTLFAGTRRARASRR